MKKSRMSVVAMMVILLVCFLWMTGCAKKAVQQGDASGVQTAAPAKPAPVKAAPEAATKAVEGQTKEKAAAVAESLTLEDIHFDFDKSVIRPKDRDVLKNNAAILMKNKGYAVVVEGHCDERGTTEYNLALGERRAQEAMKYLVSLGVAKESIKTISYGKERPLDPAHNEEAWSKNRRAHFVVKLK